MPGCEAKVSRKGKTTFHQCGMRAVVQTPKGLDLRPGAWFCAQHAPLRLLATAESKPPVQNTEGSNG